MTSDAALQRLHQHYQSMPPVAAMQVNIAGYDGSRLRLHAPLSQHVNDKGCAFGGSLASMMTLASWGVMSLGIEQAGLKAEVFVADSQTRYLAPLFADLDVHAELAPGADWDSFLTTLRERRRARTSLIARALLPEGGIATEFTARYVAIAKP
ncbi:YiiD C-terminal domain-containing protein [Lysobacter sp. 1R34A]|jgi:thioesterase domain-containing protein|uniref:YiiD C-terminal domain-containing protein n=1 Tax=Lysobacter sp. 1R34A TaxID=3445786 RepID=UPI003EEFEA8A